MVQLVCHHLMDVPHKLHSRKMKGIILRLQIAVTFMYGNFIIDYAFEQLSRGVQNCEITTLDIGSFL